MNARAAVIGGAGLLFAFGACADGVDLDELSGVDLWGGRKAHPAVVNPVVGQDPSAVISLDGEWDFTTFEREGKHETPQRNGIWGHFFSRPWKNARKISVPGCWEAQGVGEPGMAECWEPKWDENAKPIRHCYFGAGWYRRNVAVPAAWRGQRIWIKFGGVKSVAWVWVNGRQVALVDASCGTVKYEITDLVEPGKPATVVVQVDNRPPSRKGLMSAMNRWGGIYRSVELEATPPICIDDAWVRGDFDKREAQVMVEIAGEVNDSLSLRATVDGETAQVPLSTSTSSLHLAIPLRNFRSWSPEHPNLYTAKVELVENGRVVQTRRERFGVRKLEVRGKEFYLNGKPFYFRGFGDDHVYPLTGVSPADVGEHRRHLAVARKAGFNFVRLHTHCELPEYFEAADELGIMIQAELPYYSDVPTEHFMFDPKRDVAELWRNYRRHPSFAVYSMGNEGSFGPALDKALHRYVKRMDPDRLKINQDCHVAKINTPENSDYDGGPTKLWPRGSVDPARPFVTHEYMNLGVKLDARQESRYTGVWLPPSTRADRAKWLARFGLDSAWGDRLQDAQHVLQGVWQKRGIECARTDPFCDGFVFWTIVDVVVWNAGASAYSGQGVFNVFWEQKEKGLSAEDIRVFNRPAGIFVDFADDRRTYSSGERIAIEKLWYANYGDAAVPGATVEWTLDAEGRTLASGNFAAGDLALGAVRPIGSFGIDVPALDAPVRTTLRLRVAPTETDNAYDLWLFPRRMRRAEPKVAVADELMPVLKDRYEGLLPEAQAAEAEVVIASGGSPLVVASLTRGQKVIALSGCSGAPNVKLGWWWMGSQVGTAFRRHPALDGLPHQGALNELFFRIMKEGRKLPYSGLSKDDMIAVGEGGDACYLYLAQANVGRGRLLMSFGLDVLGDTREGAALLDGMLDYVRSDAFAPHGSLASDRQGNGK